MHVDGPQRGTFRDFEAGKSGGVLVLHLVEHVNDRTAGECHDVAVVKQSVEIKAAAMMSLPNKTRNSIVESIGTV